MHPGSAFLSPLPTPPGCEGAVTVALSIAFQGPGGETGEGTRLAPQRLQTAVVVLHGPCKGLGATSHDQHVEDVTCVWPRARS